MLSPKMAELPPARPNLSLLESLPTELLEQIFLKSLNINLPLASPHLTNTLSSTHTKTALVLKVFSTGPLWPPRWGSGFTHGYKELRHYHELRQILWTQDVRDNDHEGSTQKFRPGSSAPAFGELQSKILACRWMTWDFMQLCMENLFVGILLQEFRAQNLLWPKGLRVTDDPDKSEVPWYGGAPVQESAVRDFVHESLGWETKNRILKGDDNIKDNNNMPIRFIEKSYVWGPNDETPKVDILIGFQFGDLVLKTGCKTMAWKCPLVRTKTNIPLKLFRGPWTEDRISFLFALDVGGANIKRESKIFREIGKQGLMEAIGEDNYPAIWAIKRASGQFNWLNRSLKLMPDIEHLRLAVIERGCRKDIVGCLLDMENKIATDPVLVKWAEKMKEQGDEKGQWLLEKLEESDSK